MLFIYLLGFFACFTFGYNPKSALVYGSLNELSSVDQFEQQRYSPMVVVTFSSIWCTPCKAMTPIIKKAATSNSNIMFIKVDVDDFKRLADDFKVARLPSVVFMRSGRVTEMFAGTKNDNDFTAFINRNKN